MASSENKSAAPSGGAFIFAMRDAAYCTSWITLPALSLPCARYWPIECSSVESDGVMGLHRPGGAGYRTGDNDFGLKDDPIQWGAGRHAMSTWTLILLLNFGTPQQTEIVLLERVTWEHCIARGFAEIRKRGPLVATAVRCEPGNVKA